MIDFIKMMAAAGCDITGYVKAGAITTEQKEQIIQEVTDDG